MALREIQAFLTRAIRDPRFRQQWNGPGQSDLINELGLTDSDIEQIGQVPFAELEKAGEGMRSDRVDKRRTEFSHFLNHLALYMPEEEFLNSYDAAYTTGRESVPVELDWFLTYSMKFLANNRLPDYLISLARFCYEYSKIAFTPMAFAEHTVESPHETGLETYHIAKLCDPNCVQSFRFDALEIAESMPHLGAVYAEKPCQLLFVKSREAFKRTTIWRVADLPSWVSSLIYGSSSVGDLLGIHSTSNYSDIVASLLDFRDAGVLEFVTPPHHQR